MANDYVERLLIEADANARKADEVMGHLMDTVNGVEDADPVVTVDADTHTADRKLDDTKGHADELDGADPTITPKVDDGPATKGLADVSDKAEHAGGASGDRFGASFIRDVGANLGGDNQALVGIMGDFADGLTTAAESVGIGGTLAGSLVSGFTTAFAIAGVAGLAIKGLFDYLNQEADASRKRVESITTALGTADATQSANALRKAYGGLVDQANKVGVSTETVTRFISGQSDSLGDLDGAYQRHLDNLEKVKRNNPTAQANWALLTSEIDDQAAAVAAKLVPSLQSAQDEWSKSTDNLSTMQQQTFDTTRALNATTDTLLAQARTALPAVRTEILNYIAVQNGIPLSRITEISTDLDPDDVGQVQRELDALTQARSVAVTADLKMTQQMMDFVRTMKQGQTVASSLVGIPTGNAQTIPTVQASRNYTRTNGAANLWP